jgi:DNA replication protein DnaC
MAEFRDQERLEDFDFGYNLSIKKCKVDDLATYRFVSERRDVLWVGPPGMGKSHLCQKAGLCGIRNGFTVYFRSIFDRLRDFLHHAQTRGVSPRLWQG